MADTDSSLLGLMSALSMMSGTPPLVQYSGEIGSPEKNRDDLGQNIVSWGGTSSPNPI